MMSVARKIDEGRASLQVIQQKAEVKALKPVLVKYDHLMEILDENHQLVLGVLETVDKPEYVARTTVPQELLDSILTSGAGLLRVVDRDMLKLASSHGSIEDNAIYSSLGKLRESLSNTIKMYPRMAGS